MLEHLADGGPAFPQPCTEGGHAGNTPWGIAGGGMSQRALMATILMHGELVTDGVPGEAADALIEAADAAGREVEDQMAFNAVLLADALLRALAEPKPQEYRPLFFDEQQRLNAADRLAAAVSAIQQLPEYAAMPADLRARLESDLADVTEPQIPF